MNNIEQLIRECDALAARYYSLDAGSRQQAARDWRLKCEEVAKMINNGSIKPIMDEKGGKFSQSF